MPLLARLQIEHVRAWAEGFAMSSWHHPARFLHIAVRGLIVSKLLRVKACGVEASLLGDAQ
eukprot:7782660-Lingulodinium_polyedra.AAC.1